MVDSKSALDLLGTYRMYIYFFHCFDRVCWFTRQSSEGFIASAKAAQNKVVYWRLVKFASEYDSNSHAWDWLYLCWEYKEYAKLGLCSLKSNEGNLIISDILIINNVKNYVPINNVKNYVPINNKYGLLTVSINLLNFMACL